MWFTPLAMTSRRGAIAASTSRGGPIPTYCHLARRVAWRRSPCGSPSSTCRSEEHTSELQSLRNLVCRLLLEKKTDYSLLVAYISTLRRRGGRTSPAALV